MLGIFLFNLFKIHRFNRLAWGSFSNTYGIIAAGKENGELDLYSPSSLLESKKESLIMRQASHGGPIRGLDFNPIQPNLLASGATDGEVILLIIHF